MLLRRREAGKSELAAIKEWKSWRAELGNQSAGNLASELRKLAAAWAPSNSEALNEIGQVLEQLKEVGSYGPRSSISNFVASWHTFRIDRVSPYFRFLDSCRRFAIVPAKSSVKLFRDN
jgi:hypothetical protein